jgi:hypothetical protein
MTGRDIQLQLRQLAQQWLELADLAELIDRRDPEQVPFARP